MNKITSLHEQKIQHFITHSGPQGIAKLRHTQKRVIFEFPLHIKMRLALLFLLNQPGIKNWFSNNPYTDNQEANAHTNIYKLI